MNQTGESQLPTETDVESVVARNLRLNFPRHEISIPFETSDSFLGANFKRIAQKANKLPDTFGLCGVMAVTANGLMANKPAWEDVDYDPTELKAKFDSWWLTKQGESAWMWFDRTHKQRFKEGPNDFAVLTAQQLDSVTPRLDELGIKRKIFSLDKWNDALNEQELNKRRPPEEKLHFIGIKTSSLANVFDKLSDNEGIDIAVLCEYPVQKGTHTHWLAARQQADRKKLLIAGDLKPFGIPAVGISVPIDDTLQAMDSVIGASPTTSLTKVLAESNVADRGLHNDKMFLMNFVRRRF